MNQAHKQQVYYTECLLDRCATKTWGVDRKTNTNPGLVPENMQNVRPYLWTYATVVTNVNVNY